MKARFMILTGVISLAIGALTSCSDAVYATVETATKTATNTLPLLLSIIDVAVTSPGSTYSVASGAVFEGSLSGVGGVMTWNPNATNTSRPYNPPGLQCFGGLALFTSTLTSTTRLYGGFFNTSGNPSLWQSDASYSFSSSSATQLNTAAVGEQATFLQALPTTPNSTLFMGGAVYNANLSPNPQYQYELDWSQDGVTWAPTNLINLAYPVAGTGWDGTNFWAASNSTATSSILYWSPGGSLTGFVPFPSPGGIANDVIQGLFVDPVNHGRIFVTMKRNGVFYSQDYGTTWTQLTDSPAGSSSTYPAGFLCAAGPVDGSNGTVYLVGSDGYGYYTVTTSPSTPLPPYASWGRFGDSTILLYTSSVRRIVVDNAPSSQEDVFMGTNLNGLWRGVFNNTLGSGTVLNGTNQYWIHE